MPSAALALLSTPMNTIKSLPPAGAPCMLDTLFISDATSSPTALPAAAPSKQTRRSAPETPDQREDPDAAETRIGMRGAAPRDDAPGAAPPGQSIRVDPPIQAGSRHLARRMRVPPLRAFRLDAGGGPNRAPDRERYRTAHIDHPPAFLLRLRAAVRSRTSGRCADAVGVEKFSFKSIA